MRHDGPAHTARPDNPPPTITYRRLGDGFGADSWATGSSSLVDVSD